MIYNHYDLTGYAKASQYISILYIQFFFLILAILTHIFRLNSYFFVLYYKYKKIYVILQSSTN